MNNGKERMLKNTQLQLHIQPKYQEPLLALAKKHGLTPTRMLNRIVDIATRSLED